MTFREWLSLKWHEHKQEVELYEKKFPEYDMAYYFKTYKWWLKREYQYQQKNINKVIN